MSTQDPEAEADEPTRTKVFERENFTEDQDFFVTPDDTGISVPGPGSLDTLLVICSDNDQFGVLVETEDATLIDDDFSTLEPIAQHMEHISATTDGNNRRIIAVNDFPFRESVRAQVRVFREDCTFDRVRAVYTIGKEVDY